MALCIFRGCLYCCHFAPVVQLHVTDIYIANCTVYIVIYIYIYIMLMLWWYTIWHQIFVDWPSQSFCRNNFRGWTAKWPFAVLVYNIYIYTRVGKENVCPNASCSDCCIVLCCSWPVVVVVVECCYCIPYRLVLMLILTFAPSVLTFAPCALTFVPCTCGVILLSTSARTPLACMVVVTNCNWHWSRFPSAIGTNSPGTSGSVTHCNLCWWSFPPPTGADTPLELEQLALCGGGPQWW